ncbi:preprotein translocase subunit YajC [Haliea sp. AH-315-K21]|uniref:Sec translocon accessory complex subunit YajC n=1 Tax=SAR86 cluster bacterium TaxID=2030880 RepID=A0A2A5CCT4_9GAMM|nr:preprotein translocase subunit YajC [Haliea sp. AH-315-K21]PCJ41176.1 MAG: preprotein translocase subunit YajC [SAR86 cluster bacterium]
MDFFISSAYAQTADDATQSPWTSFIFLGGFILIFYFMLIRPQSKRAKEHKSLIQGIGKGDEVITAGGILGKVTKVDEQYVSVTVAENVELKMQKSSVSAVLPKGTIKSIEKDK